MIIKHVAIGVMYMYIAKYWLFHSYVLYSNLKEFI